MRGIVENLKFWILKFQSLLDMIQH